MTFSAKQLRAREHFHINGLALGRLCLHHKNPDLQYTDPDRYNEWRPEDLMVMTIGDHMSLHWVLRDYDIRQRFSVEQLTARYENKFLDYLEELREHGIKPIYRRRPVEI